MITMMMMMMIRPNNNNLPFSLGYIQKIGATKTKNMQTIQQ